MKTIQIEDIKNLIQVEKEVEGIVNSNNTNLLIKITFVTFKRKHISVLDSIKSLESDLKSEDINVKPLQINPTFFAQIQELIKDLKDLNKFMNNLLEAESYVKENFK